MHPNPFAGPTLPRGHSGLRPVRLITALALGLVLLAAGCAYESAGTTTSTAPNPEQLPPATGPAALVFEDQLVDGSAVTIGSVTLPADGFVVLQADAAGVPGEVVGVSELIGRGTVAEVSVALFLPLDGEAVLHASLHIDMDEDGRFLFEPPDGFVDLPAISASGSAVVTSARVGLLSPLGPAEVTLAEQRSDGEEVVVAEVTLPAPGFVALHADEDGLPGAILGVSELLPEGTSREVAISLGGLAAGRHTVFAVAYIDRDADGQAGITQAGSADEVARALDGGPARSSAGITVVHVAPAGVEVADQEGDGTTVVVASVTLPSPGFVEVRADDGGSPGRRLAAGDLLPTGTTDDLEIELGEPLTADAVLWVRVRIDLDGDGELGTEDPIALDAAGRRVVASLAYTLPEDEDDE